MTDPTRYLARAEALAPVVPGLEGVTPRAVERVGVVGGGTMGSGIGAAFADAGWPVTLIETDAAALERARERIRGIYRRGGEGERRIGLGTDRRALADADLVVEAVFEDMAVKQAVFRDLGALLKPGAILATNTSYLDVDAIAAATRRPADVLGLHFFGPAHRMRLLEVVRAQATAPEVLATALAVAKRLGKIAIVARVAEGFVGNRIWAAHRRQCEYLLEDGASPSEIDAAMEAFGFKMGPFAVFDLSGLDIAWRMRQRLAATRDPAERYVEAPDRLCEAGRLGRKTGAGWYRYPEGARRGEPDPWVEALIAQGRAAKGIVPRSFTPEEIRTALLATMVNEAARLLEEGIAQRPSDVDVAMVHGYGFPAAEGGPLFWADRQGLASVLAEVEALAARNGPVSAPAPLLLDLVRQGAGFTTWKGDGAGGTGDAP